MDGIGLAGCGRTGAPVLARLREAGFAARGFDPRAAEGPRDVAAAITGDAAAFAAGLETLLVAVRDIAACEALLFEDQALVRQARDLRTIVILSTLSPRYVRALRARIPARIALIDAPVSGSPRAARTGRLTLLVGGSEDDVQRVGPILSALGRIDRMGDFGSGMATKGLHDIIAATTATMKRSALQWADALGIDEARLLDVVGDTVRRSLSSPAAPEGPVGVEGKALEDLSHDLDAKLTQALSGAHLVPPVAARARQPAGRPRSLH